MRDRASGRRRRQRRLPVRRQRVPGPRPSTRTNYWVDATFDRTVPPDTRGPSVTETAPPPSASDVGARRRGHRHVRRAADRRLGQRLHVHAARRAAARSCRRRSTYDAQTRTATLVPTAPLAYARRVHGPPQGRRRRRRRRRRQPAGRRQAWTFTVAGQSPADGPGGPILVLTDPGDQFDRYYAEILRGEGLNAFTVAEGPVTTARLDRHTTVVLLRRLDASPTPRWRCSRAGSRRGGNLIAMRPGQEARRRCSASPTPAPRWPNGYLKVDGGVGRRRRHRPADPAVPRHRRPVQPQRRAARSPRSTPTAPPRPRTRPCRCAAIGTGGGEAAAFAFDLARSVVWTRQGNPDWAGDKRDGTPPLSIRPNDLFYGAKAGDVEPDWVDPRPLRRPAGRRAAAAAGQPHHADEPRQGAAAALLVPAARREGRAHPHRRRPRHRRHARVLRPPEGGLAGRLLGRGLGVRARDVLRVSGHADHDRAGRRLPGGRLRDRPAPQHRLPRLHAARRSTPTSPASSAPSRRRGRTWRSPSPTARTASSGATGPRSRRSSARTASASTRTTTTRARRTGSRSPA